MRIPPRKDIIAAAWFLLCLILLGFSAWWAAHEFMSNPPYVDPERYPVRGIDVSSHNGPMNLDAVRNDGYDFIFIKATEGVSFVDENFKMNYWKARHAGLKIGAYHFFRFDKDGVEQAIHFLKVIGEHKTDFNLVIDIEDAGNAKGIAPELVTERLVSMVEYMNLRGFRPMFYTNRDGYEKYLMDTYPGYPLWICSFNENPIDADWTFWQYDHHGKVAGVRGDVDLNTFIGSREDWEDFINANQ